MLVAFTNRRQPPPAPGPPRQPSGRSGRPRPCAGARCCWRGNICLGKADIPRILQLYLKALGELTEPRRGGVRLLALNDDGISAEGLRRCGGPALESQTGCNRGRGPLLWAALRLARGCDQIICGHVARLPVAWLARP